MDNVGNNLESKKQVARCYMQQYNVHTFYSNKIPLSSIYEYKYTYNKIKKNMAWIHIKFMIRLPLGKEENKTCEENIWSSNFNI